MNETLVILFGFVLRLGIPIAVTVLAVFLLKRLDIHWQIQAEEGAKARAMPVNPGCWEFNKCDPKARAQCKAYTHPETPCWQVFRSAEGLLQEKCLGCKVFEEAPAFAGD